MRAIPVGLCGEAQTVVTDADTARAVASGTLPVFGTPMMLALMEQAALQSVTPFLEKGETTVGTLLSVSHDAATPVGMRVRAETEVTAVEGRKIIFRVKAFDEAGPIGEGTHERFVVSEDKFLAKTYAKRTS